MHNTPHSEESKRKMSEVKKGKHFSPETQFKKGGIAWNTGRHYRLTDDHRENIRKSLIGNKYQLGKKQSAETIKKRIDNTVVWNKDTIGVCKPNSGSFKKGQSSGEKNVNWKGGVTLIHLKERGTIEYKLWQKAVIKRDGYHCQRCGENRVKKLMSHHILNFSNHPELRVAIDNGVTFCRPCHKEFHTKYGVRNNNLQQVDIFCNTNNGNNITYS